jgi:hypothetical protein
MVPKTAKNLAQFLIVDVNILQTLSPDMHLTIIDGRQDREHLRLRYELP